MGLYYRIENSDDTIMLVPSCAVIFTSFKDGAGTGLVAAINGEVGRVPMKNFQIVMEDELIRHGVRGILDPKWSPK